MAVATSIPVSILIVDDRLENRTALKSILSSSGYRIVEADSGATALRRLLDEEFAMILLDVLMPGMNGFELASAIKERERAAGIPILFLTAQATDMEYVYRGYRAGAVDYIVKPIVPEMVRSKVAVFAELYRQRKRIEQQSELLIEAERRESELRLMELKLASERRYRNLAEAVPHIVWTSRPDGTVDYFNRRWFEYTGLSLGETAESGFWVGALHPDDAARCRKEWQEAMRSGHMFQTECRLRRGADRSFRWHLVRAIPERGPRGECLCWLGTFTDIEDQKRVEVMLAEFKGTLDAVFDAVFIFDPGNWKFLYVNHGAGVLLGYSRDELFAMRPLDFMTEHDENGFRRLLGPLKDRIQGVVTLETRCRRKDGREIPVEFSLQHIRIDGGRIVSIARDITDRKRAEIEREMLYRNALDAVRARDEFLSVASHELRTPLTSLQLQIEMILRPPRRVPHVDLTPDQLKGKLEMAVRQIDRMSRLITQLMDVSRITAGKLRLEFESVDLAAMARDVISRLGDDAARAQSTIALHAERPVVGQWDRMRIDQVVTNLLANAIKFGAGKPIDVQIEEQGPWARLVVRDRGIGIEAEDMGRIFGRFERATSARAYGGLGLGLYIVRQIVDAHGGTIRVESQPGAGSVFTVQLPREPAPAKKEEPSQVRTADTEKGRGAGVSS
jgi:PAS domain S-box-containing protein